MGGRNRTPPRIMLVFSVEATRGGTTFAKGFQARLRNLIRQWKNFPHILSRRSTKGFEIDSCLLQAYVVCSASVLGVVSLDWIILPAADITNNIRSGRLLAECSITAAKTSEAVAAFNGSPWSPNVSHFCPRYTWLAPLVQLGSQTSTGSSSAPAGVGESGLLLAE